MSTKRFSTFEGVFTPCLLSILGVIMYLRLGWIVGSVGIGGALLIIVIANLITLATALSMSSIVTNIKIGHGGAYSIIKKSLGIEAGGAIGIPLYISQAISAAFYIRGFAECWYFVFPKSSILIVSIITWAILLAITFISARLAFRVQYFIMALVGLSILSVFLGKGYIDNSINIISSISFNGFWKVFAVFFPAVTGILAGASMSGELNDPKTSIPRGTLWAISVSFCVYIIFAFMFALKVPVNDLLSNSQVIVDIGRWKWMVISGIMGATISSGLSMLVGSPRILLALGKHSVIPKASIFDHVNKRGEPTYAILFTALISIVTIVLGSLNEIAGILTMFFLITYGMINMTVFIEQSIGIASFRPSFRVYRFIPFLGSIGCFLSMFLIDIRFSIIAILVIIGVYVLLLKREGQFYSPDIRSGMLVFIAEQFSKAASRLPYYPKIWKPNLLVPVDNIKDICNLLSFIKAIVSPSGRVIFFKIYDENKDSKDFIDIENNSQEKVISEIINDELSKEVQALKEDGIFIETTVAQSQSFVSGATTVMQAFKSKFFPPNTFFYILKNVKADDKESEKIIENASIEGMGIVLLQCHPSKMFGEEKRINLWIRKQSPNISLAVLIAIQLEKNWDGQLSLVQVVDKQEEVLEAQNYLEKLKTITRMSSEVEIIVLVGNFKEALKQGPKADINIFGMQEKPDIAMVRSVYDLAETSIIFLKDSKHESALA